MKLSICIPTYNKPKELRRLLDSIAQQTYTDFEIIISDDTPDADSIKHVIAYYYSLLPIRYYHHDKPLGSPQNWNFAIDQAHGEYIKLMHDDDWFLSADALQIMVDKIETSSADFVWSASKNISDGKVMSENHATAQQLAALQKDVFVLFVGNFISAPSAMICRRTDLRYDKHIKWYVDVEYYSRLLKGGRFAYIDQSLVGINNEKGRVTDECITNYQLIYTEFFYCWNKFKKEGVISNWKSYYWLYKFMRLHRPALWKEVEPYSEGNKTLRYITYQIFRTKLALDLRNIRK